MGDGAPPTSSTKTQLRSQNLPHQAAVALAAFLGLAELRAMRLSCSSHGATVSVCAEWVASWTSNRRTGPFERSAWGPSPVNPSADSSPPKVRCNSGSFASSRHSSSPWCLSVIGTQEYSLRWYHITAPPGALVTRSAASHVWMPAGASRIVQLEDNSSPVSTFLLVRQVSNATRTSSGCSHSPWT